MTPADVARAAVSASAAAQREEREGCGQQDEQHAGAEERHREGEEAVSEVEPCLLRSVKGVASAESSAEAGPHGRQWRPVAQH